MNKVDEIMNRVKLAELLKKEEDGKKVSTPVLILAIVGGIALIAGIAYGIYRFFAPDYLEDFEDEFEDEFDDDFFNEDDEDSVMEDVFEEE